MNKKIKQLQLDILNIFSNKRKNFALAGGTALELYYLHHRFSKDLDFFSSEYNEDEIRELVTEFEKIIGNKMFLENEFITENRAKVKFYTAEIKGEYLPFKIDFVEDVFFSKPEIKKFDNVPVYEVEHIYYQKIIAVTGTRLVKSEIGREITTGRSEEKDIVDIYYLSKQVNPIHMFLKKMPKEQQKGMVYWYRNFSRQDLKLNVLNLDIYDKSFDSSEMIKYIENEIKKFMESVIF